jgi:hypothetical protein
MNRELSDSKYGTHMVPLITAIQNTSGDVFEMGCGDYSTPIIHAILSNQNRKILSADTSLEWLNLFTYLETENHSFKYVKVYDNDWDTNPNPNIWDSIGNQSWGVVFIDHRPGERRKYDIKRFEDKAEIIVIHDTEEMSYNYEQVLCDFKFRYDYKVYNVYTTLVSNTRDVSKLFNI